MGIGWKRMDTHLTPVGLGLQLWHLPGFAECAGAVAWSGGVLSMYPLIFVDTVASRHLLDEVP